MSSQHLAIRLVIALLVLGLAHSAVAQQDPAPEVSPPAEPEDPEQEEEREASGALPDPAIEEIVVTARRREERLQETPISITTLSADDIGSAALSSVVDIGAKVPNLYLEGTGSGGGGVLSIRSQTAPEVQLNLDPAVGVYLDGVYLPRQRGNLGKLYDVERIEVMRGPQGTLFGRSTTAGAIQVISRKPSFDWGGYADVVVGSDDRYDVQGAFDIPILDEELAARLAFNVTRRNDGYTDNELTGQNLDDDHTENGRATLVWRPTERLESILQFDGSRFEPHGGSTRVEGVDPRVVPPDPTGNPLACFVAFAIQIPQPLVGGLGDCMTEGELFEELLAQGARGPFDITSDVNSHFLMKTWGVADTTTYELDGLSLRNIASYRNLYQEGNIDVDGSRFRLLRADLEIDQWQMSEEFHVFGSSLDETLDWITGLYFFYEKGSDDSVNYSFEDVLDAPGAPAIFAVNPNVFDSEAENTHASVFGQLSYQLPVDADVRFTGGLRYNWDNRDFEAKHRDAQGCTLQNIPPGDCSRDVSENFDEFTWTLGLDWRPDPGLLLYLAQRRGYRSGGFNLRALSDAQFDPFDPEIVTDVEIGAKADWELFGGPIRTNIAAFYADYDDIQRTFLTVSGLTFLTQAQNAAKAHIWGGEAELFYVPHPDLELRAGVGVSIARYDDFVIPNPGDPTMELDRSDERFTNAPDYSVTAGARYTLPFERVRDFELGTVSFQVDYSWVSRVHLSFNQDAGSVVQNPYSVWDGRMEIGGVLGSGFDLAFVVQNMFDREYLTGAVNLFDTVGFGFSSVGPPRTYAVQLTYRFGNDR